MYFLHVSVVHRYHLRCHIFCINGDITLPLSDINIKCFVPLGLSLMLINHNHQGFISSSETHLWKPKTLLLVISLSPHVVPK